MGNRLTLPLLLLAALLAGGAFFWMTGEERGTARAPRGGESAPEPERASSALSTPELLVDQGAPKPASAAREALSESSAPKASPKSKGTGVTVRGSVVDRFGTPIPAARVSLAKDTGFPVDLDLDEEFPWLQRKRTVCDAGGLFQFEGVEPGVHQVAVRAHGFAPQVAHALSVLKADTQLDALVLARGAILTGEVLDPNGRPVPEARIIAQELGESSFFVGGAREPVAVTGADGRFRVDELACGPWQFRVASVEHPDLIVEGISEEPGVEQGGLRWQLAPGATVSGTVTGIPPAERGMLEVRASRAGSDEFLSMGASRLAKVEPSGSFLLRGLEVGETYTLQARHAQPEGELGFWERSRSSSAEARAGDSGIVLAYKPEAALVFTVFDSATRAPLENFQVESGIEWPVSLTDDEGRTRKVFPGGEVRLGGLRPSSDEERVQLKVSATGYREYSRSDIAVRAGQELDLGSIYLDPVPVLRVHVTDRKSGAPVVGARVRMQKEQGDTMSIRHSITIGDDAVESLDFGEGRMATTDEDGWAELTSFEGETVELSASAKGYAPGKLPGVVLPRGIKAEQELKLGLGGEVLVHVVDAQGAVLPGARVEHRAESGNSPGGMVFSIGGAADGPSEISDARGEVLCENLAPGTHSFRIGEASSGGGMFATGGNIVITGMGGGGDDADWSQVQVLEGERVELTLRAPPRASLEGRVREAGKVLAGATLRLTPESSRNGSGSEGFRPVLPFGGGGPETRSDGEGRYGLEDVKAGRYKLAVEHPTRRMPLEVSVELREGENTYDVELPLSLVAGRVLDTEGKPLAGVQVWPERQGSDGAPRMHMAMVMIRDDGEGGVSDTGQFGERAITDADGRYTLRGVACDVDLCVKASGDSVQPGSSEVLRVAPNETREGIDLRLEAAGSIRVEARHADGSPANMQLVQATYLEKSDTPVEPKLGFLQAGSTELKGLRPGRWKVNVRNAQGGPTNGDAGEDREVEVKSQEAVTASFEVD